MIRAILTSLTLVMPTVVLAEDMSAAEREAFRAEVRAYLLENPEVLVEAMQVLEQRQRIAELENEGKLIEANFDAIFNDGTSWVGGNPDGDVTMVEFVDYRCGFCKRAFPEVQSLVESDGNIRYIVKEFPILGPESEMASRAALATLFVKGPQTYGDFHNRLMTFGGPINAQTLENNARKSGFDFADIEAEMDSERVTEVINSNRALAQKLEISGTPTFLVGKKFIRGYMPETEMANVVGLVRRVDAQ